MENEKAKKANMITAVGVLQIAGGVMLILLFFLIDLIRLGLNMIGSLFAAPADTAGFPAFFVIGIIAGGIAIRRGYLNYKLASRFRRVARVIGDNPVVSFINLERRLYWSRPKLLKTLKKQVKNGFWPNSYIDMTDEVFVLDYNPVVIKTGSGNATVDEKLAEANNMIQQMASAGHQIKDEQLKARIEKLVDIARQIYSFVAKHPEKEGYVRQLSNYFLPTTVGLLEKYIELQNQVVKTESMSEAIQKITEVMDTLEAVFKNQLDTLYNEKVMDVDVEIEVLQNMADV